MEKKLFYIAFAFMFYWIAGQVGQMSYADNLISAIAAAIGMAIWQFYVYKPKQKMEHK